MSTLTITNTVVTGQVTQPDYIQGVSTIASFRDGVVVATRIGAEPLHQIDADLGLAWSSGEH